MTAAAAYRHGARITDERTGLTWDYRRRQDVLYSRTLAPDHAPAWARDPDRLWNAVEASELRRDAQLAREAQLALPHELTLSENIDLVERFAQRYLVTAGMIADIAIHGPHAGGDDRNVHAHILMTLRSIGPEGFGKKERSWNSADFLELLRAAWEDEINAALESHDLTPVSSLSYAARGIDLEPEPKLGPIATRIERRGRRSRAGDERRAVKARNAARLQMRQELAELDEAIRVERLRSAALVEGSTQGPPSAILEFSDSITPATSGRGSPRESYLSKRYQRDLRGSKIAKYWRILVASDGLHFLNALGEFVDHGDRIIAREATGFVIDAMLDLAQVKGWDQLRFNGSDAFRQEAIAIALKRGFRVSSDDADAQFIEEQRAQIKREAGDHSTTAHHPAQFEQTSSRLSVDEFELSTSQITDSERGKSRSDDR